MKLSDLVQFEEGGALFKIVDTSEKELVGIIPLEEMPVSMKPRIQYQDKSILKNAIISKKKVVVWAVVHILNEKQALSEAEVASECGADGVFFICHYGDQSLTLSLAQKYQKQFPHMRVGVNLLSSNPLEDIDRALALGINNVWLDNAGVHSKKPDIKRLEGIKSRCEASPSLVIFGGVAFKYQPQEPKIKEAVALAEKYGILPTTSGEGTGLPADLGKIKEMSEVSRFGLAVASGMDCDNIGNYAPYLKHAVVATGVSIDEHHFDKEKLKLFVEKSF